MLPDGQIEFGRHTPDDIAGSEHCLKELQKLQRELETKYASTKELFEPAFNVDLESRKELTRKIKHLDQTAKLQSIALYYEFIYKLIYSISGYCTAVENKNPLLIYLSARYCLELVATLHVLNAELQAALLMPKEDWQGRGIRFITTLLRGRFSASDPTVANKLQTLNVPKRALDPININKAVQALASREIFKSVVETYDHLSNLCHHNGSAGRLFGRSLRMTNMIATPSGGAVLVNKKMAAVTYEYPATGAFTVAFVQTARVAYWSCYESHKIIRELPESPFEIETEKEALRNDADLRFLPKSGAREEKIGRNELCSCGSGKKYKKCCGQ